MASIILPNTLQNGQPHDADEVMANFAAIKAFAEQEVIQRDGSVAMTGQLSLVGDPAADAHAARKKYVDDKIAAAVADLTSGWTVVTPASGFSTSNLDQNDTGGQRAHYSLRYKKMGGIVFVNGALRRTSSGTGDEVLATTLPAGFRPPAIVRNQSNARSHIKTNGQIVYPFDHSANGQTIFFTFPPFAAA